MTFEGFERRAIVREARSWVRTPYHPQGDIKGIGVDCGMLLVRVFVDTGLCAPFDPRPYADDWYLHRAEERYLGFIFDRAKEVAAPLPGDVGLPLRPLLRARGHRDRREPADYRSCLSACIGRPRRGSGAQHGSLRAGAASEIFLSLGEGGLNAGRDN
jgi:hypothetical protein